MTSYRRARPAYGHNQGGHQDCKPWVVGNIARPEGLPIPADVNDGNFDDTVWSQRILRELTGLLQAPAKVLFVADCKAIQQKTLDLLYAEDPWFVSRLPNSFKAGRSVKLRAGHRFRFWENAIVLKNHCASKY